MSGWEVTARLWEQNKVANRYDGSWLDSREEIVAALVDDVGINRIRIEVRSGMENTTDYWAQFVAGELTYEQFKMFYYQKVNDNDDPRVTDHDGFHWSQLDFFVQNLLLPMQARLQARGERLFINLCFVDFRRGSSGDVQHALAPDEYAEFILAAFEHLRERYGVTPDALEIILEPENTPHWRGEQIGRALVAVAPRLAERGFTPQFIAPSTTGARNAPGYIDEILRVPGAAQAISTFSYHNYDNPPDSVREAIRERAERVGASTAMLEHLQADPAELHRDLTVANAVAWQQYGVALLDEPETRRGDGYLLIVNPDRAAGRRVRMTPRAGGFAQFFRNVRIGAVRIAATSDNNDMLASAFVNPDGGHVAVIVAARAGSITINGLPNGSYQASFAPEDRPPQNLTQMEVTDGQPLTVNVPGRGVFAIRQAPHGEQAAE
jgi:hypothetical protein